MKRQILSRHANSDFIAYQTAQGMENAGATVFSVTHNGMKKGYGAIDPSSRFIVWCAYASPVTADLIDHAIGKEMGDADGEA